LVARIVTEELKGSGLFMYAAHPSQAEDVEDHTYSGPRWYVTCTEALLAHFRLREIVPVPPGSLQELLWPCDEDRNAPWLTELGWTLVPENSDPQEMHADICDSSAPNPRGAGRGRYHHFVWKVDPTEQCTTNIVPGAFTEGCAEWEHYDADRWRVAKARALIFDSEMLHRGGATKPQAGWTTSLTLQVCSGVGYPALQERISSSMMCYTMQIGWAVGDAVEVLCNGKWHPAIVTIRSKSGLYSASLEGSGIVQDRLQDVQLRDRTAKLSAESCESSRVASFHVGAAVEALCCNDETWHLAKVVRRNADDTYRVHWKTERSFTDGLKLECIRLPCVDAASQHSETVAATSKRREARGPSSRSSLAAKKMKRSAISDGT